MTTPGWSLLETSLVLVVLTAIALRPARRPAPLAVASFGIGMVVAELALHHLAWQSGVALTWVAVGALEESAGRAAVLLLACNALALWWLYREGRRSRDALEAALRETGVDPGALDQIRVCDTADRVVPLPVRWRGLERLANLSYAGEGRHPRQAVDVYRRPGLRGAPIFVYFHGGGWVLGSRRDQGLPLLTAMARNGWLAVAAGYRLSPAATWPDHLHDVLRAVRWVRRNGASLGGNPNVLVVAGNSAGGHLAALAALAPRAAQASSPGNRALERLLPPDFDPRDAFVDAAICLYGVYDVLDRYGTWPHDGLRRLWASKVVKVSWRLRPELYDSASPIAHVGPHAPDFFVVHGTRDSVVPIAQARHFVEALRAVSRRRVAYAELAGAQHAYDVMWSERATWQARAVVRFCEDVAASKGASPAAS